MVNCLVIGSPSNSYTDCYIWPNIVFRSNFVIAVPHSVIESMAATSLTVKWDAPAGERTSYIVTLDDGSGSEETKTPDQESTSAKFTGLAAGKSYTVRLVTVSRSAKFYTCKYNGCFYEVWKTPHGQTPSLTKVHQDKTQASVFLQQSL